MENSREDERERREDEKARLRDLWEAMGPNGYFAEFIKRPTQAQVKECIAELDRTKPGWERGSPEGELCDLLLSKFPELERQNSKKSRKAAKKKESAGCAGLVIFVAIIGAVWIVNLW